jgi:hypothetical protein
MIPDRKANDMPVARCACGFFLAACTPGDAVGRDGARHERTGTRDDA